MSQLHLGNQRWELGRDSYRPPEPIRPSLYEVAEIEDDTTARGFVAEHHYSGSYVAARVRVGLYRGGRLEGVAVFSVPANDAALTRVFACPALEAVELGRFVLLDAVPGNGETWFLARCFELLRRRGVRGVLSLSDPEPRTTARGEVRFGGHVGTIYQAHNARYLGRATPRTLSLLPDGTVFSEKAKCKIRRGARGQRYAVEQLVAHGARRPRPGEDLRSWLRGALAAVCRPMRHHGNHRYAWALDRRLKLREDRRPYPKAGRA